ncbi:SMP-30/gluconolactonase/LRE family protein [Aeromicrobium tamlense]|uniref:Gluconolactonase n=1 Tax=Aeromicrobium tamlense TaxID=375541 RepID=A0A8I0KHN0_9ACTN|nr:SMP-30/gluconolactonase/LRE family protein [Aeromicrobium tamlense]MBD1270752.1 SMP-30/gluconolactonase/LRE family protein [Aeromicrobium tamlense]MBD1271116.1 SMP-30/gluconolactonase/LRE family protein [Aeromicrobium tamlense]NYI38144.1 gluconolactonase [Aeromicrobium tamlense]
MKVERFEVLAKGMGFVEAPLFDAAAGVLVADETAGGVWRVDGDAPSVVVRHRRGISGTAIHRDGWILVSGRNLAARRAAPDDSPTVVLIEQDERRIAFGDMVVDHLGRVLVGALGYRPEGPVVPADPPPGQLLCLELDGSVTVVNDDILLPNGIGVSPDGRTLYHVDSVRNHIVVHEISEGGAIGPARPFADIKRGTGDGLAVAADGSVWVATLHAGAILVLAPDGTERGHLEVERTVTSLCFSGDHLQDLVVTSVDGHGGDGRVLRARGLGPGVPVPRAAVQI